MQNGKRKISKNECFVCKSKEVSDRGWTVHKPKCMYYGDPWGFEARYTIAEFNEIIRQTIGDNRMDNEKIPS